MTDRETHLVRTLAGRYELGARIGHGGMADVHLGTDTRLGRQVAIKLLKPSLAEDPAFRSRFRREAQAAARMAHPTIVRVFDAGEETVIDERGDEALQPFIVMEYVDGRLLKDVMADGPMAPELATRIITGVLTALEYSHRAGVVHRDIKPGNIMVTPAGQVKVMDFGIARAITESQANVAQTSAIIGTAQYFSPEQARGETVDSRTDLYSTGVVLYEMLAGRPLFTGDTPVAVAYQHVSETPKPPSTHNAKVSPSLDSVVLHALAKDRSERFQSAAEFRADVEAAAAGQVPTRRIEVTADASATLFGVHPNTATDAAMRQLTATQQRPARSQSRPPVAWIWAGVAVMGVIIAAVLYWTFSLSPNSFTGQISIAVPEVAGMTYPEAAELLVDARVNPTRVAVNDDTVPEGQVIGTDPRTGVRVAPGDPVRVMVSLGRVPVDAPFVERMDEASAIAALQEAGLVHGTSTSVYSASIPAGIVVSSDPAGGAALREGDTVNLTVSNGLVQLPELVGQPVGDAARTLTELNLTPVLQRDNSCTGGTVVAQSLPAGDQPQRSSVTLRYCP